jgi:O-antigen ligase
MLGAYISLLLFMLIYCARPEDWIPGLAVVPVAKMSGFLSSVALVFSIWNIRQRFPPEILYFILLTVQLFAAAFLSPVWQGGAFQSTLVFAKILVILIVIHAVVNTSKRLHRLIFIQGASVAVIALVAVWKGHQLEGRLEGTFGGSYSNPNDLALAIVITLPLCLAVLFLTRNRVWKAVWALAMMVMIYGVFLTGSRGGFLALIVVAVVSLWEFAIRGRRRYLLVVSALVGVILWQSSGGVLRQRLKGTFESREDAVSAYDSAQQRQQLFWRSIEVTLQHPLFGVGLNNFAMVSGNWHVTHNSFTEMSSEGGVPAFVLYVLILLRAFKNTRAARRIASRGRSEYLLAGALHASLAGYLVGALFASTAYEFFPYFLVAYTTALLRLTKEAVRLPAHESVKHATSEKETLVPDCPSFCSLS